MIGVNIGHHDSSICHFLLGTGDIEKLQIILNERISRRKNAGGFPLAALRYFQRSSPSEWQAVTEKDVVSNCFGDHPRLTEESMAKLIGDYTLSLEGFRLQKASFLFNPFIGFTPHHLSHAYSVFPVIPYEKALIVVSDGAGSEKAAFSSQDIEWDLLQKLGDGKEHFSVYSFDQGKIKPLEKDLFRESYVTDRHLRLGVALGSHFEYAAKLIFNNWKQAGKVMGLSAFGHAQEVEDIQAYLLSQDISKYEIYKSKEEFDSQDDDSFQRSADFAASVQLYFEKVMLKRLKSIKSRYPDYENIVLVGGCALNGLFNMKLVKSRIFKQVFVPPFPNDEGVALGCAIKLAYERGDIVFKPTPIEGIHPYYGPIHHAVELNESRVKAVFNRYQVEHHDDIVEKAAELIEKNNIVAWMQGRSEVGPRALGHRSILCRTDIPDVKNHLNDFVKYREKFRPYGGTVLKELAAKYFDVDEDFHSPFMTFCAQVRPEYLEKLAGVRHVDGTCRLQTLCENQNPLYYKLLKRCHKKFGLGMVLNTSLNLMDQPIVETLEDALLFFEKSKIKHIIIGSHLIRKSNEI